MPQGTDTKSRARFSREEMRDLGNLASDGAGPRDNGKRRIARIARVLSLSTRRAAALWYGDVDHEIAAAETARLRAERERLYQDRLARLRAEIAETEQILLSMRRRADAELAQAKVERAAAKDRTDLAAAGQGVLPLGCGT